MTVDLKGAFSAIITPFRDGKIDEAGLRAHVERQIENGIDGLVPCGTTGESATMTEAERLRVIEITAESAAGRVPIVAGTSSNDTRASIDFTRRVAAMDVVDAALAVTPYYNKPSQKNLVRHFNSLADAGNLPLVLYNVPGRTALSMSVETIAELSRHPQIIGLKEATGDVIFATRIREAVGDSLRLLSGDDFTTFPFLSVGGDGCISVASNIVPAWLSEMCRAVKEDNWRRAQKIHYQLQPLARALFSEPNPIPVKACASILGWCSAEVRAPLYLAEDELLEVLRPLLDSLEFQTNSTDQD